MRRIFVGEGTKLFAVGKKISYSYDNNGNTVQDGLKGLQISYNILNLPQTVTQSGTTKATYGWFADGSKYSVQDAQGNGYCYIGSLIYSTTAGAAVLESTDFSGGRIVLSGNTQTIHYHHKDHLGSVRAITDGSGSTIEQNAYYPFGGRHNFGQTYAQIASNRYKFNGKELQTTGNLGLLDYGARMYDAKIARWLVQDPLAEKLYSVTPYRFSLNNPTNIVDPDGLSDYFDFNGQYLGSDGANDDFVRIITQENWQKIQITNQDGVTESNVELALQLSTAFSEANMEIDAILNVYDNYNITGLDLKAKDDKSAGMTFVIEADDISKQLIPYIRIPVQNNRKNKFIDNANNIINSFAHENTHYRDYKKLGLEGYLKMPKAIREKRAIAGQKHHPSYSKTTESYKNAVSKYWNRDNY